MKKNIDLLESNILPALTKLALPIMATSFIQMAYNLIDMIWIGRVGSGAVTAVGTAGMYLWFSNGIVTLARIGGQVQVGYSIGSRDYEKAANYTAAALQLSIVLSFIFGLICVVFSKPLITFLKLTSPSVIEDARHYLMITCGFLIFAFLNQVFSGIMTALGKSLNLLLATSVGLILNIVLDPLLIFGIGPFPRLDVIGAAIATVIAQAVVTGIFILLAIKEDVAFKKKILFKPAPFHYFKTIIKIGTPASVQSIIFTSISMVIARLIAGFGEGAIAVQKIGSQIESISWMISDGFAAAINTFMAQNHGAGNHSRIVKGYSTSMVLAVVWGLLCSAVLIIFPEPIFHFFLPDTQLLSMGVDYLRILGVSQLFMCIEISTAGAFSGLGQTIPPSVASIVFTAVRIPLAYILIATPLLLNGIWWSITISSILKGTVLSTWFIAFLKKRGFISAPGSV